MINKLLIITLAGACRIVFANEVASATVTNGVQTQAKVYNSPTSGTNRYSNGNFGAPKTTGKSGEQYYSKQDLSNAASNAQVMGSTSYSSRDTSKIELDGKKGQKYYTKEQLQQGQNQADRGSQVGSNQLFNYPTTKNTSSATK